MKKPLQFQITILFVLFAVLAYANYGVSSSLTQGYTNLVKTDTEIIELLQEMVDTDKLQGEWNKETMVLVDQLIQLIIQD